MIIPKLLQRVSQQKFDNYVKKERFMNKNNVLSVMMLVNIVLKNQMISA